MVNFFRTGLTTLGLSVGFLGASWLGAGQLAQAATLADRGLPTPLTQANSVRWVPIEAYNGNPETARFKGDEFTVDAGGKDFNLDKLSVFVSPGYAGNNPDSLADWFKSVFLRIDQGEQDGNLSANETVAAGNFDADTNSIDNSNILFSNTGKQYTTSSQDLADIWRLDFINLDVTLPSTKPVRFGVKGVGRSIGNSDFSFPLFLMASNSSLSGYSDDQNASTDDSYLEFFSDGTFQQRVDSAVDGWNKSSDILVQAHGSIIEPTTGGGNGQSKAVPEPSLLLGVIGLSAYGAYRKNRPTVVNS